MTSLLATFDGRDMGNAKCYVGITITRNLKARTLTIAQERATTDLLAKFGMLDSRPKTVPMSPGLTLTKAGEPLDTTRFHYSSLVGGLLYLAVTTRPDICFPVGCLAKFMSAPTVAHWKATLDVLRYLNGTRARGITYTGNDTPLHAYCDADYAGDPDTRKSTTGYVTILAGGATAWSSRRQATVAVSTAEAEVMAGCAATKEVVWQRMMMSDFGCTMRMPTAIMSDNQSALSIYKNPVASQRSKHIDIQYHFARERSAMGQVAFSYVSTAEMVADCLTKAVPLPKLQFCCRAMGMK